MARRFRDRLALGGGTFPVTDRIQNSASPLDVPNRDLAHANDGRNSAIARCG